MMKYLEQALRLNNEGVNMMIQGQDREGAHTLTQALSILQTLLQRELGTPGIGEANPLTSSYISAQKGAVANHCKAVNDDPTTHLLLDTALSLRPTLKDSPRLPTTSLADALSLTPIKSKIMSWHSEFIRRA